MHNLFLSIAIITEVIATSALKASGSFTKVWPSAISIIGYIASFYFLSLCMEKIPIGVTYAVWSGVGIVLLAVVGYIIYHEKPDVAMIIGMGLIILGVLIINLFSKTAAH